MRILHTFLIGSCFASALSAQWLFGVWPKPKVPFPMTTYQYEVELVDRIQPAAVGAAYPLSFRVKPLGRNSHQIDDPPPVRVTLVTPAGKQRLQHWLFPGQDGVYRGTVALPKSGHYQVYFETGSRKWTIVKVPLLVIDATHLAER